MVGVTACKEKIYVLGGSDVFPWRPLASVNMYDPRTDTWTRKRDMPTPRFGLRTCLLAGKIFAIGGSQSDNTSIATVEVYDPETDLWEKKR
ncbi:MAG: hypothetical protein ACM3Q4_11945 [Acidobacteriota bacterium]